MKIRSGLVSNSSSSSFIIRGFKVAREDLLKVLNIEDSPDLQDYTICDEVESKVKGISCVEDNYFFSFDGGQVNTFIVGKDQGRLSDGLFVELEESNDTITGILIAKLGLDVNKKFKTYIRMISNDNF